MLRINRKNIWHDRDSNPKPTVWELCCPNPTAVICFWIKRVGSFGQIKKEIWPHCTLYWMNNFSCIFHILRKITTNWIFWKRKIKKQLVKGAIHSLWWFSICAAKPPILALLASILLSRWWLITLFIRKLEGPYTCIQVILGEPSITCDFCWSAGRRVGKEYKNCRKVNRRKKQRVESNADVISHLVRSLLSGLMAAVVYNHFAC